MYFFGGINSTKIYKKLKGFSNCDWRHIFGEHADNTSFVWIWITHIRSGLIPPFHAAVISSRTCSVSIFIMARKCHSEADDKKLFSTKINLFWSKGIRCLRLKTQTQLTTQTTWKPFGLSEYNDLHISKMKLFWDVESMVGLLRKSSMLCRLAITSKLTWPQKEDELIELLKRRLSTS